MDKLQPGMFYHVVVAGYDDDPDTDFKLEYIGPSDDGHVFRTPDHDAEDMVTLVFTENEIRWAKLVT